MLKENHQDRKWTVLESEIPHPASRGSRHEKTTCCCLQEQKTKEYYVLEYPDWINVQAITRDGKFLMERQYRRRTGDDLL